jgi:hypothetical protein
MITLTVAEHPMDIAQGGLDAAVAQLILQLLHRHPGLKLVGGIGMPTGIPTLLINRRPIKFTIDITLTLARGSTLFADCDDKVMKRSS